MIYKDENSKRDTIGCPSKRYNDICLNCRKGWDNHFGWACCYENGKYLSRELRKNYSGEFNSHLQKYQYLTILMKNSLEIKCRKV
jgi:hypothetical protein